MTSDQATRLIDILRSVSRLIPSQNASYAQFLEQIQLNQQIDELSVALVGWSCDCASSHSVGLSECGKPIESTFAGITCRLERGHSGDCAAAIYEDSKLRACR